MTDGTKVYTKVSKNGVFRACADARRILDRMAGHQLTEVVEKVQTFEAASTFYGVMVNGVKESLFFDSIV